MQQPSPSGSSSSAQPLVDKLVGDIELQDLRAVLASLRLLRAFQLNLPRSSGPRITPLEAAVQQISPLGTLTTELLLLAGASPQAPGRPRQVRELAVEAGNEGVLVLLDSWLDARQGEEAAAQRQYEEDLAAWEASQVKVATVPSRDHSPIEEKQAKHEVVVPPTPTSNLGQSEPPSRHNSRSISVSPPVADSQSLPDQRGTPKTKEQRNGTSPTSFMPSASSSSATAGPSQGIRLDQVSVDATKADVYEFLHGHVREDQAVQISSTSARAMGRCLVVYLKSSVDSRRLAATLNGNRLCGHPVRVELAKACIIVGNIPLSYTAGDIADSFLGEGFQVDPRDVSFLPPRHWHTAKQAFVDFDKIEEAERAINERDQSFDRMGPKIGVRWRVYDHKLFRQSSGSLSSSDARPPPPSRPEPEDPTMRASRRRRSASPVARKPCVVWLTNLKGGQVSRSEIERLCRRAVGTEPIDVYLSTLKHGETQSVKATIASRRVADELVMALDGSTHPGRIITARLEDDREDEREVGRSNRGHHGRSSRRSASPVRDRRRSRSPVPRRSRSPARRRARSPSSEPHRSHRSSSSHATSPPSTPSFIRIKGLPATTTRARVEILLAPLIKSEVRDVEFENSKEGLYARVKLGLCRSDEIMRAISHLNGMEFGRGKITAWRDDGGR